MAKKKSALLKLYKKTRRRLVTLTKHLNNLMKAGKVGTPLYNRTQAEYEGVFWVYWRIRDLIQEEEPEHDFGA